MRSFCRSDSLILYRWPPVMIHVGRVALLMLSCIMLIIVGLGRAFLLCSSFVSGKYSYFQENLGKK